MKNREPAKMNDRTYEVFGVIKIGEVKADSWWWAKQHGEILGNSIVPFKPRKTFVEEKRATYDKSK